MHPCLKFLVLKDLEWAFHVSLFEVFGTKGFCFQCVDDDGGGGGAEGFFGASSDFGGTCWTCARNFWLTTVQTIITTHLNSPRRNSPVESQQGILWILKTVKEPVNLEQESQEGTLWILKDVKESENPQQEEACDNYPLFPQEWREKQHTCIANSHKLCSTLIPNSKSRECLNLIKISSSIQQSRVKKGKQIRILAANSLS